MTIPVPTNRQRQQLRVKLRSHEPVPLGLLAQDASRPYTHYLKRKVTLQQDGRNNFSREVVIRLPLSPDVLTLNIHDGYPASVPRFELEDLELKALPPARVWAAPHMHDFMAFAQDFSEKAGYLRPGFYYPPDHQFLIHYVPHIRSQQGKTLITPARTHRITGRHQVSKTLFRPLSIPIRMFILLHERQHFTLPTREEVPADLAALQLYLDLGFPTLEAVYAATKVFQMHPGTVGPLHTERTRQIIRFINDYRKKQHPTP